MILGTKRPVPQKQLDLRASIHNRFDLEVYDAATGDLKRRARAFNVICDAFWSRLFDTSSTYWHPCTRAGYILYGGGSGTPAASDTALFNRIGAISLSGNQPAVTVDRKSGVAKAQTVATLNAGDAVGSTITEVGFGYDSTHCTTHAMLQDMNGNPISITKTDTDVIKIYGTLFLHWPAGGWYNGAVNFASSDASSGIASWLLFNGFDGYGGVDYYPRFLCYASIHMGTTGNSKAPIFPSVDALNKTLTIACRYNAAEGNVPIMALSIDYMSAYNATRSACLSMRPFGWYLPAAITGESVGTGDGSIAGFNTAFPVKTSGTVYVDGAAAAGATMRTGPADAGRMEQYFNQLAGSSADDGAVTEDGEPLYARETQVTSDGITFMIANVYGPAFENPFYSLGLSKFQLIKRSGYSNYTISIQASDDCAAWSDVGSGTVTFSGAGTVNVDVPAALKNKKYFRFSSSESGDLVPFIRAVADVSDTSHNITFATPPASGAVITADYTPDPVAKDENHVFDLSVVLTLGERTEE